MINPVRTMADDPMMIHFDKFIIEKYSPLHMEQFSMAVCGKVVAKCVFTRVFHYKVFECIRELLINLGSSYMTENENGDSQYGNRLHGSKG